MVKTYTLFASHVCLLSYIILALFLENPSPQSLKMTAVVLCETLSDDLRGRVDIFLNNSANMIERDSDWPSLSYVCNSDVSTLVKVWRTWVYRSGVGGHKCQPYQEYHRLRRII